MQLRQRQQGLGLWGWIFILSVIGFVAMITMQLVPLYLAEMSIERVVKSTAQDPANAGAPIQTLRRNMQTRWDVEGITTLDVKDVELVKSGTGRALAYDYEARAELFANIALVVHFEGNYPLPGGGVIE
jgi:hypothetical protein